MANPALVLGLIIAGLVLTLAIVAGLIALLIWLVVKLIACAVAFIGAVLAGSVVAIIVLVLIVLALALLSWFVFRVHRLPLSLIGLGNLINIPAVPFSLSELPGTALRLARRNSQTEQAKQGLSAEFTIGGRTTDGYTFMYGTATDSSYTRLTLEQARQYAMGWTTLGDVQHRGDVVLGSLARTLTDKDKATEDFWPIIAQFGLAYNLIIIEKVAAVRRDSLKATLGAAWTDEMQALQDAGNLYVIDMTFFAQFPPASVDGFPRFTPATLTLLRRDPETQRIAPIAIQVSGQSGAGLQHFVPSEPAWLYAVQAAKASITVWGIWLGHVYHWHIVTAAMQMTMFQTFGRRHIVRQLLGRQSKYLIAFDEFMLLVWGITPPTSVDSSPKFLQMMDAFAAGRPFFADDPKTTLETLGLRKEDFSKHSDWDLYRVVGNLLAIWDACERYVGTVIDASYAGDDDVRRDAHVQAWIKASADPARGNVQGLPAMDDKAALKRVLTSLVFRVTAHGASRLNQAANPMLTFAANFPPCLQIAEIPRPETEIDAARVLTYLPNTGTIGALTNFLFTFIYSTPYEPFIPLAGIDADLSFTGATATACNAALVQFRRDLQAFMTRWAFESDIQGPPAQIHQWELNIET
jgi:hypothetical protein